MTATEITSHDQFKQIINSGNVALIDLWATWCGPRRFISPGFEILLSDAIPGAEYYKVDVDDQEEVGIKAMPTFMVFKDGEKFEELVGADPDELQTLLSDHCSA
ncbi:hypothetical protein FRC04_004993 [Tulasnella sp. 424]|nr:hypothetical protein FRC04_004993 [Tulasnella sp. 424]KAG8962533.1 hypothetical protein FRC05_005296 [Tulasnella sp. 425]